MFTGESSQKENSPISIAVVTSALLVEDSRFPGFEEVLSSSLDKGPTKVLFPLMSPAE